MVKIISDSTCDLSEELLKAYDIDIIPLQILLGEDSYEDGRGITSEGIFEWSDAHKACPKTAAVNMERTMGILEPYITEGREVVVFTISSHISATYQVVGMAAESLGGQHLVHVVDSLNLATGVGIQVLAAADLAREGKTAAEIVEVIKGLIPRVRTSFVVDTLTYLHRGGRCSGLTALLGGTLKLHPRISLTDGKMSPGKKFRGKINRVIVDYAKDMEADLRKADPHRVFITHSGCDEAVVEEVKAFLTSLNHFEQIHVTRTGGVISSHCGPGTLGVIYADPQ